MSSSAPLAVSPELKEEWEKATQDHKPYRFLKIQIKDEKLTLVDKSAGTPSVSKDFDSMRPSDSLPCYFLFRVAGPKNWLLISYIPENTTSVGDKMVYAASKSTLKARLNNEYINEEVHFSSPDELSYNYYLKSKAPSNAQSEFEKMREKIHNDEEDERKDRIQQYESRSAHFAAAAAAAASTAAAASSSSTSPRDSEKKIGGYHQVQIPLSKDAKEQIGRMRFGEVNFVELAIDPSGRTIEVMNTKSLGSSEVGPALYAREPRFYVYSYQHIRSPGNPKANLFIYCCPDSSSPQLRMTYSTAKPCLAQDINALGIQFAKKIEIRGGDELTEEYFRNEVFASKPASAGRFAGSAYADRSSKPAPAASRAAVASPHPIYSLMTGDSSKPAPMKKKIVIPPRGAY